MGKGPTLFGDEDPDEPIYPEIRRTKVLPLPAPCARCAVIGKHVCRCPTCGQEWPRTKRRRAAVDAEPVARSTDPETSHDAAESVERVRERQFAVLAMLMTPATDEEIALRYGVSEYARSLPQSPSGLRTRRSELVDLVLVRRTEDKRRMRSGRLAIVWEATISPANLRAIGWPEPQEDE